MQTSLTEESFSLGLRALSEIDPMLAKIMQDLGPPPMWAREPGFPTLLHIILEQQVSLASAKAAFDRLRVAVSPLTPRGFLKLDDATLKTIGFSRQKTAYGRHLAQSIIQRRIDLKTLGEMSDADARLYLMQIKGIGSWTADIYLLMALRRPDIWPNGDRALAVAVQKAKRMSVCPSQNEIDAISAAWQPWRAVAARILWHYYLSR